ncbi:prepilin peptidase [Pseudomonas sp. NA-150]|uniref:prepilin peptidase n=1 Tax=Pseudomonas sp. NA-150 TaxID=3367525 RepID=UPI0037CC7F26
MQLILLLAWLVACAEQDARQRQISNWLTFGAFAVFLLFVLFKGQTWLGSTAAEGGWALLLALAFTLPGYALGRLGAGDVKLLAALALASDSLHLLGTFVGAGVASIAWLLIRQYAWPHMSQWLTQRYRQLGPETSNKQPFAPFLLVGFVLVTNWIH